jgi:hypothetical protein
MAKKKTITLDDAIKFILDSEEDKVPKEMFENPELYLALTSKEADYVFMDWLVDNHMPSSLRSDRNLMEKLIKHSPTVFKNLGTPLNDDLELLEFALAKSLRLFESAGQGVKKNKKIVDSFFKRWLENNPNSLEPILWVPLKLVKELKIIESSGVKQFPSKSGYNRFVIEITNSEITEKKADSELSKHASFIQAVIKDKKAEIFGEIFQKDESEECESVETTAFLYIKDLTLAEMDDYFNKLCSKKIKSAYTAVFDIDNPEYMNYNDGEVSSGSIGFDSYDDDFPVFENAINRPNLSRWKYKILEAYL